MKKDEVVALLLGKRKRILAHHWDYSIEVDEKAGVVRLIRVKRGTNGSVRRMVAESAYDKE